MTEHGNPRCDSGKPKPQWLIDFANEMRTPGKAPREPFAFHETCHNSGPTTSSTAPGRN